MKIDPLEIWIFSLIGALAVCAMLACGTKSEADPSPLPPDVTMECRKIRLTPDVLGAWCQNEHVRCVVTSSALSCDWSKP